MRDRAVQRSISRGLVAVLRERGISADGSPVQVKTWNLSSLWRIPTTAGDVWLKAVPPFFAHEGAILSVLQGERVPVLLGHEDGRALIAPIAGEDLFEATEAQYLAMVTLLVDLQRKWIGRTDELLALGLPDLRGIALAAKIADVVERTAGCRRRSGNARRASSPTCRDGSRRSPHAAFPTPWSTATSTPGTFAGSGLDITLLDWGDSGVGHPLLDQPAFLERMPAPLVSRVEAHWVAEWQRAVPGSDPARRVGAARADRRGASGGDLPDVSRQHRAQPSGSIMRQTLISG